MSLFCRCIGNFTELKEKSDTSLLIQKVNTIQDTSFEEYLEDDFFRNSIIEEPLESEFIECDVQTFEDTQIETPTKKMKKADLDSKVGNTLIDTMNSFKTYLKNVDNSQPKSNNFLHRLDAILTGLKPENRLKAENRIIKLACSFQLDELQNIEC